MQYRLRDHAILGSSLIPHFAQYELETRKSLDYKDFVAAHQLMAKGAHLTEQGLDALRTIKLGMNRGRSLWLKSCGASSVEACVKT